MRLITLGVVIWIIENMYFGWNRHPESKAEYVCDIIAAFFIVCGCFKRIFQSCDDIKQIKKDIAELKEQRQ